MVQILGFRPPLVLGGTSWLRRNRYSKGSVKYVVWESFGDVSFPTFEKVWREKKTAVNYNGSLALAIARAGDHNYIAHEKHGTTAESVGMGRAFAGCITQKRMIPKWSKLVWYKPWDIIEMIWFWGRKVKGKSHRVNKCMFTLMTITPMLMHIQLTTAIIITAWVWSFELYECFLVDNCVLAVYPLDRQSVMLVLVLVLKESLRTKMQSLSWSLSLTMQSLSLSLLLKSLSLSWSLNKSPWSCPCDCVQMEIATTRSSHCKILHNWQALHLLLTV